MKYSLTILVCDNIINPCNQLALRSQISLLYTPTLPLIFCVTLSKSFNLPLNFA